jgi:Domain of unknown function (DUF1737)
MKPYKIIEGSSQAIEEFEEKIADALEIGYCLAGELVAQSHALEMKFYQPVLLLPDDEDEDEEDDEDEDDEEWELEEDDD